MTEKLQLFDSHAHLLDERYEQDLHAVVDVDISIMCMASPYEDLEKFRSLLKNDRVWGSIGIHPHDADKFCDYKKTILKLVSEEKVQALGEIGLDYYYDNSPRKIQREVFSAQIDIALSLQQPVVIHIRDAFEDSLAIMKNFPSQKFLVHCFTGTVEELDQILNLNSYVSVGGMVTFKKAENIRSLAKAIPSDKLLIETDCPYLAPVPQRGKRNEPKYIKYVAEALAKERNISVQELADLTYKNTIKFFNL